MTLLQLKPGRRFAAVEAPDLVGGGPDMIPSTPAATRAASEVFRLRLSGSLDTANVDALAHPAILQDACYNARHGDMLVMPEKTQRPKRGLDIR